MGFKEDILKVLNHETPEHTPVYFVGIHDVGFASRPGPAFERGPAGGGYDGFGVRWVAPSSGGGAHIPAPGEFILTDITRWKKDVHFPDLDKFNWEECAAKELQGCDRNEKAVDFGSGNGVFERLASLMGFEEALLAMAEEPEACNDFFTAVTNYKLKIIEKVNKYYNPDFFTNYDDKLSIIGGYDNNGQPGRPDATEEDARAEVRRCYAEYGKYKGYMFFGVRMTNTLDFALYMKGMAPMVDEAIKCSMTPS